MTKDPYNFERYLQKKFKKIQDDPDLSERNKEIILRYIKESQLGKTVRKGQKREIGAGRNLQVAGYLNMMAKDWFKKDLDKVTQEDMEKFILDLNSGNIQTSRNNPGRRSSAYSSGTKANIKKFIRKFYKWLLTDNKQYPDLVEWIDTSKKESEVKAVKGLEKGVWQIVELIPTLRKKAMIWATFDSGFRAGEITSCTLSDLEKREDGVFYLKCRESKTRPRTVSLPLSSELLQRWLEKHPRRNDPNANLWLVSRRQLYKTVTLYGKKALGEHITVHMLRHTSATYYATRLDRTTFCKRFGWSYSSQSPDRYIDFAKVTQKKVVNLIKGEQMSDLKQQMEQLKIENALLREDMTKIKEDKRRTDAAGPEIDDTLQEDPELQRVFAAALKEHFRRKKKG